MTHSAIPMAHSKGELLNLAFYGLLEDITTGADLIALCRFSLFHKHPF